MRTRNFNRNSYRQSSYGQQSAARNYERNYERGYQNDRPKKHSGCSIKQNEDGTYCVSGWKLADGCMVKLYARPYKGTKITTSKSGKRWANLFVTLTNTNTLVKTNMSGLLNLDNKKLYISEMNLVANPKAPNGGYFGKQISKVYNR
jgi:hypothetical protein